MYSVQVYDEQNELTQSLYPSLSMAKSEGILLKAGRKTQNDIVLGEKSASRDHCQFRVVSNLEFPETIPIKGQNNMSIIGQPCKPRNDQEVDACQRAPRHTILVLESLGKRGCHVLEESGNGHDSATDGEETDDEGQQSQIPLSQVSKQIATNLANPFLKPVPKDAHYILDSLNEGKSVVIQCGGLSTIVVQQHDYKIMLRSDALAETKDLVLDQQSYAFGVHIVNDNTLDFTHLISLHMDPVPKQIAAWSAGKHTVSPDFLVELFLRSSPTDPLPQESRFRPQSKGTTDKRFSNKADPHLWKGYTFLSWAPPDAYELMVASAGPEVVKLHEMKYAQALKVSKDLVEEGKVCFSIHDAKGGTAKGKKRSPKKEPKIVTSLRKLDIPFFSFEDVAKKIIEQKLLVESTDKVSALAVGEAKPSRSEDSPDKTTEKSDDGNKTSSTTRHDQQSLKRTSKSIEKGRPSPRKKSKTVEITSPEGVSPEEEVGGDDKLDALEEEKEIPWTEPAQLKKRKIRPMSAEGWTSCSSKKVRLAVPNSKDDNDDVDKQDENRATTVMQSGLFVNRTVTSRVSTGGQRSRTAVADFKKFRKNICIPQSSTFVHLKAMAPEATDSQRELRERNLELEEQRRRADELFEGPSRRSRR